MPSMLTKESFLNVGLSSTMEGDGMARGSITPPTTPNRLNPSSSNDNTKESCTSEDFSSTMESDDMAKGSVMLTMIPHPLTSSLSNISTKESCTNEGLSSTLEGGGMARDSLTSPTTPNPLTVSSSNINTIESCTVDGLTSTMQGDCMTNVTLMPSITPNSLRFPSTNTSTNESCINDMLQLPMENEIVRGRLTPPLPPNTLPKPAEDPNVDVTNHSPSLISTEQSTMQKDQVPGIETSSTLLTSTSQRIEQEDKGASIESNSIATDDLPIICATYYDNLPERREEVHSKQNNEQISTSDLTEKLNKLQLSPETEQLQVPRQDSIDPDKPPKKRASSLKLTKTPPDQKHKKIVKFADVFGLDIEDVREFVKGIPDIPKSAYADLTDTTVDLSKIVPKKCLSTHFKDPCDMPDFWERVLKQKVCVERVMVGDNMSVRGVIRVLNLSFDKKVFIRYTLDKWKTHTEASATYLAASNDGVTDQFSFLLWGNFLKDKGSLAFVVRYETLGQEYWDNNKGNNYKLHCVESLPGTPYSSTMALEKSEKPQSTKKSLPRVPRHLSIPREGPPQSMQTCTVG
ncbi:unnamed protein product [Meganyctiphanes norvegica]|uniref:CBM21 domain-containing protein n=1 Tax=Meganyctiphanes norvegica TaxID=48144 RepID=A0AAV2PYP5_MEGNR